MSDTLSSHEPYGVRAVEIEIDGSLNAWRGDSSVYWDHDRQAWIVTGYDEVAAILQDAKRFWRDIPLRSGADEFWGPHLLNSQGARHRRLHALHMKLTGEQFAEDIRDLVARIALDISRGLLAAGKGELAAEYADTIPFLVGFEFLGLDTSDRSLMEMLLSAMRIRARWKEALHAGSGIPLESRIAQEGIVAIGAMTDALLPTIRRRRDSPGDDLISAFWTEGTRTFADWDEVDMVTCCWSCLDNETKPLLRGLLYLLCRDQAWQSKLRAEQSLVPNFVEEGIRYLTPFRTIRRVAISDVELGGQKIRAGDGLYLITPLANRDESKWECPHSFRPSRPETATHFGFGLGAGYCVGRYVGRVEASEAIKAIVSTTSRIALDPDAAEKPRWSGEMYHSIFPLHAIVE